LQTRTTTAALPLLAVYGMTAHTESGVIAYPSHAAEKGKVIGSLLTDVPDDL
jgi:hypothetical protein